MGGLEYHFGGRGLHFGGILGVWAGSGSQMHLGRRSGRLLGDFKSQDSSNSGPRWFQDGIKIDGKIAFVMMPLNIDLGWIFFSFCEENGGK